MILPPYAVREVTPPTSKPEFFFLGTQRADVTYLHPRVRDMARSDRLPPLEAFVESILYAENEVAILDPHFDAIHGLPALFEMNAILDSNAAFRIISKKKKPTEWLEEQPNWRTIDRRVQWKEVRHDWIHGRFALVDGVLWHFGSTVGGMYPAFDAATRWYEPGVCTNYHRHFDRLWAERSA